MEKEMTQEENQADEGFDFTEEDDKILDEVWKEIRDEKENEKK